MKFLSAQKLIALSLMIFLSGTCCLLCCEMKVAALSAVESCPLSKGGHHCPSQKRAEASPAQDRTESLASVQTESHCPFISKRSEAAWKPAFELKPVTAAVKISPAGFFTVKKDLISPGIYRPAVRDRGGTYLKNCVFRI